MMLEKTRGMKSLLCGLAVCSALAFSNETLAGTIFVADGQDSRSGNIYIVNPDTGSVITLASLDRPIHAMAYDSARTTLYALTNNHMIGGNDQLITIDPATGVTTLLATVASNRMTGLAVADNGDLIGLHQNGWIYRINPTTGALTFLNGVGGRRGIANKPGGELYLSNGSSLGRIYGGTNFPSDYWLFGMNGRVDTIKDMAYDVDTSTLYGIDFDLRDGPSDLVEINTATGQVTKLADLPVDVIAVAVGPDADVDNDGMNDFWENVKGLVVGVDDSQGDPDNDGLNNIGEYNAGTDPANPDTDGDGLTDGKEVNQYSTDPTKEDTDGDTIYDGDEVANGTDPLVDNDWFANTANTGFDQFPDSVVDSQGNVHLVWYDGDYDISYRMLDSDGNLLIDQTKLNNSGQGGQPSIAVTSNNHVYVVYHDYQWSEPEITFVHLNPYAVPHNGAAANPAALIIDGPVRLTADDNEESSHVRLVVDSDDKAHLVWQDEINGTNGGSATVRYMKVDADGSVLAAERELLACSDHYRCAEPDIALGGDGNVHIVAATDPSDLWDKSEIYYLMLEAATGDALIEKTVLTDAFSRGMRARLASISPAPAGMLNIVWQETNTDNDGATATLSMMRIDPALAEQDGAASSAGTLIVKQEVFQTAKASRHPHARTDANGNIHLTYQDGLGRPGDITDAHYMVLNADAEVLLDREIATPNADWWTIVKVSAGARLIPVTTSSEGIIIYQTRPFGPLADAGPDGIAGLIDYMIETGNDIFGNSDSEESSSGLGSMGGLTLLLLAGGLVVVRISRKRR